MPPYISPKGKRFSGIPKGGIFTEKILLFFLFFFVPSPDLLDDCGIWGTASRKLIGQLLILCRFPTTVKNGPRARTDENSYLPVIIRA
jgi:hypothetical protein